MALGLSACDLGGGGVSSMDASIYVRGLINLTFLGQFDEDYLKLVDSDEAESQENYDGNLDVDADNFAYYYAIDTVSDDLREQIRQLYKDMYAKSKFEVKDAVKADSTTYSVEVVIEPLDIYQRVDSVLEDTMTAFSEQYFIEHPEVLESSGEPGDPAYDAMTRPMLRPSWTSSGRNSPRPTTLTPRALWSAQRERGHRYLGDARQPVPGFG